MVKLSLAWSSVGREDAAFERDGEGGLEAQGPKLLCSREHHIRFWPAVCADRMSENSRPSWGDRSERVGLTRALRSPIAVFVADRTVSVDPEETQGLSGPQPRMKPEGVTRSRSCWGVGNRPVSSPGEGSRPPTLFRRDRGRASTLDRRASSRRGWLRRLRTGAPTGMPAPDGLSRRCVCPRAA